MNASYFSMLVVPDWMALAVLSKGGRIESLKDVGYLTDNFTKHDISLLYRLNLSNKAIKALFGSFYRPVSVFNSEQDLQKDVELYVNSESETLDKEISERLLGDTTSKDKDLFKIMVGAGEIFLVIQQGFINECKHEHIFLRVLRELVRHAIKFESVSDFYRSDLAKTWLRLSVAFSKNKPPKPIFS